MHRRLLTRIVMACLLTKHRALRGLCLSEASINVAREKKADIMLTRCAVRTIPEIDFSVARLDVPLHPIPDVIGASRITGPAFV